MLDFKLFNLNLSFKKRETGKAIKPKFFSFGKKYKIIAVHKFEKSDDISGYKHMGQNSRQDQWQEFIKIESSFFNLIHEIIPNHKDDILTVIISMNGQKHCDYIDFNK